MTILRKLNAFEVAMEDLINIYILFIRSRLEYSAVVWHSSITGGERIELERVQKVALRLILREDYDNYQHALEISNLETLETRRKALCLKFAKKCTKSEHSQDIFPLNSNHHHEKYFVTFAKTDRMKDSAILFLIQNNLLLSSIVRAWVLGIRYLDISNFSYLILSLVFLLGIL